MTDDRKPGIDPLMVVWAVIGVALVATVVFCVVLAFTRT